MFQDRKRDIIAITSVVIDNSRIIHYFHRARIRAAIANAVSKRCRARHLENERVSVFSVSALSSLASNSNASRASDARSYLLPKTLPEWVADYNSLVRPVYV